MVSTNCNNKSYRVFLFNRFFVDLRLCNQLDKKQFRLYSGTCRNGGLGDGSEKNSLFSHIFVLQAGATGQATQAMT